jgi:SPP1 gp7 family putative phage head morphogenesis protein
MPWSAVSDPSSRPKFLEAIEWFRKRVPMTDSQYARLVLLANGRAFTLAGVAQLDMVADVQRSIDRALSSGESFGDWKRKIKARLLNAWRRNDAEPANPGWRLETIFRTNVQRAYSAGRHEQLSDPVIMQARPYRMYDAIIDQRTTEICQERNGTILPADDPWWDTNWPPLHFACRAGVRSLRQSQAERRGITSAPTTEEPQDGFGLAPTSETFEPSPSNYPPDLWAAYQARRAAREAP